MRWESARVKHQQATEAGAMSQFTQDAFVLTDQTSSQTRTYKPSGFWAVFLLIGSIAFSAAGAFGIWYFGLNHQAPSKSGDWILVAGAVGFLAMGVYMIGYLFASRVVITPATIEIRQVTNAKKFHRSELAGWRTLPTSPPSLVLIPKDASAKKVKLANVYRFDESFYSWLEGLPNLDVEDRRRIENEIKDDPQLGFTESERAEALRSASRTARVLNIGAVVIMLWTWVYPDPYKLLVLLLVIYPFASLAAIKKFPSLMRIDQERNDPRPSVAISFVLPGFALMLRAFADVHLLSWARASGFAIAICLAVWLAAYSIDLWLRSRFINALLICLILVPYGFGSVLELNAVLDRSRATVYSARVLSKTISRGSKHTDYRLRLGSWALQPQGNSVSVSRTFFQTVTEGDFVCLPVRSGALQIEWYVVTTCP